MPPPIDPTEPTDLAVSGTLPEGLSGHLIGVGRDGVVHSFHVARGRVSHLTGSVGPRPAVRDVVAFDGSVLLYGDDCSVRQLTAEIDDLQLVDLPGRRQTVAPCPVHDPASGELHFVANDRAGSQSLVVIPAGALTRRNRPLLDPPARIERLAIGRDHILLVANQVAGVVPRSGEAHATWTPTGAAAPSVIDTYRLGDTIVLLGLTPALERWTFRTVGGTVEREVLDPEARRFAHGSGGADRIPPVVWTTGGGTITRHDVARTTCRHLSVAPHRPGDFIVVPDTARPDHPDAGWLIGSVHHPSEPTADLRVIDARDVNHPTLATIRFPRAVHPGLRLTWLPSSSH